MFTPRFIAPRRVDDPVAAPAQLRAIYEHAIAQLRAALERFIAGEDLLQRAAATTLTCAYARTPWRVPTSA